MQYRLHRGQALRDQRPTREKEERGAGFDSCKNTKIHVLEEVEPMDLLKAIMKNER